MLQIKYTTLDDWIKDQVKIKALNSEVGRPLDSKFESLISDMSYVAWSKLMSVINPLKKDRVSKITSNQQFSLFDMITSSSHSKQFIYHNIINANNLFLYIFSLASSSELSE